MEAKSVTGMIMGLFLAITVVAVILVPAINDATQPTGEIYTNIGEYYIDVDPSESYNIVYNQRTNPGYVTINGTDVEIDDFSERYALLVSDNVIVLTDVDSGSGTTDVLSVYGTNAAKINIDRMDLTVANGTISGTYLTWTDGSSATPIAFTDTAYTYAYIAASGEETMLMTAAGSDVYVRGDVQIVAAGESPENLNNLYMYKITGTIDDGFTAKICARSTGEEIEGATVSEVAVDSTEIDGIYKLDSLTFTVTYNGESEVVVTEFIVPATVSAQSYALDSGGRAILGVIPIVVIAAIVLGSVALVATRRD